MSATQQRIRGRRTEQRLHLRRDLLGAQSYETLYSNTITKQQPVMPKDEER